jgi:hypothetical protein
MAKSLDETYNEILGTGGTSLEEMDESGTHQEDGAYSQEDYSDDAGDGSDPREGDDDGLGLDDDDASDEALEEDDDEQADEEDDDGAGDEEETEIPQRLVDAGRLANLSDDAIVELAESRPEALEALARTQEFARQTQDSQQQETDKKDESKKEQDSSIGKFKPLELELTDDDEEEMGSKAVEMIRELTKTVNTLGSELNNQQKSLGNVQQNAEMDKLRQIDVHFDSLADKVPELGKTGSLTKEQRQNRIFALSTASQAQRVYGIADEQKALAIGVKALQGQSTEAQTKEKLIRDLDKNKKRFTNRARNRTKQGKKMSVQDRAMNRITEILDSPDYA